MIDISKIRAELKKQGLPETLAELLNIESDEGLIPAITAIRALTPMNLEDLSSKPGFEHLVGQINSMKGIQSDFDRKVAEAVKTFETNLRSKNTITPKDDGSPNPPSVNPQMAEFERKLSEANQRLEAFVNGQNKARLQGLLHESLSKEKIPLAFASGIEINNDQDLAPALEKIKVVFTETRQSIINDQFDGKPPMAPKGEIGNQEISDYAKAKNTGDTGSTDGIIGKKL